MDRRDINTDNEKRGKLLFLAGFISVAMFLSKVFQSQTESSPWEIFLKAGVFTIISFLGLLWSFNFQVKKKSFLYILQASLFVFSEVLFIELFFFQKFNRLYEGVILLILLIFVFIANYGSFLMANVFNVNLFKKIPLVQVGRTLSYLLSLLMMYFFTFGFLSSGLSIFIQIPVLAVLYFFIIYIHYFNMGMEEGGNIFRKTVITMLISFGLFLGLFLVGDVHEVIAAVPSVGYFFCVSFVTREDTKGISNWGIFIFLFFIFCIFIASMLLNLFN